MLYLRTTRQPKEEGMIMTKRFINGLVIAIVAVLGFTSQNVAHASLIVADFNDLTGGGVNLSGQAGGTGFSGNWTAHGSIDVVSGDLTAPGSTNYALTQSGTANSVYGNSADNYAGHRALATALTGNTVWFSFLVDGDGNSRAGITVNQADTTPLSPRLLVLNSTDLYLNGTTFDDVLTAGDPALVLGRITVVDDGDDTWDVWFNPDVSESLGTPDATKTDNYIGAAGITTIGVSVYKGGSVDMLYVSDDADGFADVTGVPEPATMSVLVLGGVGMLLRRRRRTAA